MPKRGLILVAICALVGALAGLAFGLIAKPRYVAEASVLVQAVTPGQLLQWGGNYTSNDDLSRIAEFVTNSILLSSVSETTGLPVTDLEDQVTAVPQPSGRIVVISVSGTSAAQADDVLDAVLTELIDEQSQSLQASTRSALQAGLYTGSQVPEEEAATRAQEAVRGQPPIVLVGREAAVSKTPGPLVTTATGLALSLVLAAMVSVALALLPGRITRECQVREQWGLAAKRIAHGDCAALAAFMAGAEGWQLRLVFTDPSQVESLPMPDLPEPPILVDSVSTARHSRSTKLVLVVDAPSWQNRIEGWLAASSRFGTPDGIILHGRRS